jgi:hypothetical protein
MLKKLFFEFLNNGVYACQGWGTYTRIWQNIKSMHPILKENIYNGECTRQVKGLRWWSMWFLTHTISFRDENLAVAATTNLSATARHPIAF